MVPCGVLTATPKRYFWNHLIQSYANYFSSAIFLITTGLLIMTERSMNYSNSETDISNLQEMSRRIVIFSKSFSLRFNTSVASFQFRQAISKTFEIFTETVLRQIGPLPKLSKNNLYHQLEFRN